MCLYISVSHGLTHRGHHRLPSPRIAGYDMLVFKRLEAIVRERAGADATRGHAPYMGTRWDFGKMKRAVMAQEDGCNDRVGRGLHAYRDMSFVTTHYMDDTEVFPAIIPAGSKFYIGEKGHIVANQMTVYPTMEAALQGRKLGKANLTKHKHEVS